jgi:predicted metal-dependent hydrolase
VTKTIPTRRISFEDSLRTVPRHFAAEGDLIQSHVAAALSAVFPDGEDFFVRSVRNFRDQVTDPQLKREVAGFIGQEAMHGREHRMFNERLAELGYPTKQVERFTKKGLAIRERLLSQKNNLATTAALEHFTATLAELVLTSEDTRALFGHDGVRNLFLWHALEESEHKAVAFDVYRAVGGTERMRRFTMNVMTFGFITGMVVQVIASLLFDRDTYKPWVLFRSLRRLRKAPYMRLAIWRQLRSYNRVGFHPNDIDTAPLVERWREELFGESGTLNDNLVGANSAA